jgi:hypothetical protein
MRIPVHRRSKARPDSIAPASCARRTSARWLPLAGLWLGLTVAFATVALVVEKATAQVPIPGLTVGLSGTNLLLVITNGSSLANYEIERTPVLGDEVGFPWTYYTNGTLGQTSFVAYFGIETRGYFRAAVGTDFDSDGIPNTVDGQPNNGAVGALTITIDYPANGSNVQ